MFPPYFLGLELFYLLFGGGAIILTNQYDSMRNAYAGESAELKTVKIDQRVQGMPRQDESTVIWPWKIGLIVSN